MQGRLLVAVLCLVWAQHCLGYINQTYVICDPEAEPERYKLMEGQLKSLGLPHVFLREADHLRGISVERLREFHLNFYKIGSGSHTAVFVNYGIILKAIVSAFAAAGPAAAAAENATSFLILESDVVFQDGFAENITRAVAMAEAEGYDALFFGSAGEVHAPGSADRTDMALYPMRAGRCADSTAWSLKGARKLLAFWDAHEEITSHVDTFIDTFLALDDTRCFWVEPSLTFQGSMRGLFRSEHERRRQRQARSSRRALLPLGGRQAPR